MKTLNEKISKIFTDLLENLITNTINPEPEFRTEIEKYPLILRNMVNIEYYRDSDYTTIHSIIGMITVENIRSCIPCLKEDDFEGAIKVLCKSCFLDTNTINEITSMVNSVIVEDVSEDDSENELKTRIKELEKRVEKLEEIIQKMSYTPSKTPKFSKDNITEESLHYAKSGVRKGEYIETYETFDELLYEEEITLPKSFKEIVSIIKKQEGDTYRYFQLNKKTRIEFYF